MADPARVSDAEFARDFRRRAVTLLRVEEAMAAQAGREFRLGPYSAGGLAGLSASGRLGTGHVEVRDADAPSFAVTVPAELDLVVRLGLESRLHADVEIDLTLTPRFAGPMLLVVDVAPIHSDDVRIATHGRGLGAALSGVLGGLPQAIVDEMRGGVARQVAGLLDAPGGRRARTNDIAARIDGVRDTAAPHEWRWISDADFGWRFLRHAVTVERVRAAFAGLTGEQLEISPRRTGPARLVGVRAGGTLAEPVVRSGTGGGYEVTLPLGLDLVVGVTRSNRFHAEVTVTLRLLPRLAAGVHIVIDIDEVTADDVLVVIDSNDAIAAVVGRVGRLEGQVAQQVARVVNRRIAASTGRVIDVGERIDGARRPSRPRPGPRRPLQV